MIYIFRKGYQNGRWKCWWCGDGVWAFDELSVDVHVMQMYMFLGLARVDSKSNLTMTIAIETPRPREALCYISVALSWLRRIGPHKAAFARRKSTTALGYFYSLAHPQPQIEDPTVLWPAPHHRFRVLGKRLWDVGRRGWSTCCERFVLDCSDKHQGAQVGWSFWRKSRTY
jgi:hypothetical protein